MAPARERRAKTEIRRSQPAQNARMVPDVLSMMRRAVLGSALLLCATLAFAQETPATVSVLVPIVGSVVGVNDVHWKTDVALYNDVRQPLFVALTLPTAPDQPVIAFTIPAGATQKFADVIGQAFGMEQALSPLIVETMGNRSVRVSANIYGIHGTDVTPPEPVPIAYTNLSFPLQTLSGLSFSALFRTNIGLVNLADAAATFTLALQRVAGRNIAITRVTIPPNAVSHTSIQTLFPMITSGDDFMVVVEMTGPRSSVYASVVDNATSEAHFISPSVGAPDARYAGVASQ